MQSSNEDYKKLIEAALFVAGRALSAEELASAVGIASVGYVSKILDELVEEYEKKNTALQISKIGGKFEMGVRHEYAGRVNELAGKPELRRGALRILAYISKNEPVMQSSIVKAFGSSTYDYMKELEEAGFVSAKRSGRTKKISTTQKFREYFEIS
ncbi:MAG: SMC-Scp complex subunit ScpB [Candidatus Micrarchaeaceae archaeon]